MGAVNGAGYRGASVPGDSWDSRSPDPVGRLLFQHADRVNETTAHPHYRRHRTEFMANEVPQWFGFTRRL